jgi:exopolyphosphatase/guanosine-5'-triphosphate,3'-diphosphate pyrophosphatase
MNNIGIIDIGSNTVHLLIVNIDSKSNPKIIDEDKEHLRLGATLTTSKNISAEKILDVITVLKKFLRSCIINKVSRVIAIATEALRVAENSSYILDLIKEHTGISVQVLSSKDEAYFSYLGALSTCNLRKGIIMDTGGNSTELIFVEDGLFTNYTSIPLGSININEKIKVNKRGRYLSCDYTEDFFYKLFSNIPWIDDFYESSLVGIGGTFKNLGKIYNNYVTEACVSGKTIELSNPSELKTLCQSLKIISLKDRENLRGLSKKRADIILGGCEIITHLINYCNFSNIIICNEGLRTGILYNYLNSNENTLETITKSLEAPIHGASQNN